MLTTAHVLFHPQQVARARQTNRAVSGFEITQAVKGFDLRVDGSSVEVSDVTLASPVEAGRRVRLMYAVPAAAPRQGIDGVTAYALIDHVVSNAANNITAAFAFEEATREVAENMPLGTNVGDPVVGDQADFTYTLTYLLVGEDASCFEIDDKSGQITTNVVMDYEVRSIFKVLVAAYDGIEEIDVARIGIYVINEDEDGEAMVIPDRPDVGWPVTASLTDPDGEEREIRWQWLLGKSPQGKFEPIFGANSTSYTPQSDDLGMYLKALALYSDGEGSLKTAQMVSQDVVGPDLNASDACSVRDQPDHLGTSLAVDPGQSIESDFCSETDGDWIGVNMDAGQAYGIAIDWMGDGVGGWHRPNIAGVRDDEGELVTGTHSYSGNPNSVVNTPGEITFRAVKTGTYYLAVKPSPCCEYAPIPVTSEYEVEVQRADVQPDDVPDVEPLMLEFSHSGVKEITFDGSIETFGDRDRFYFRGETGHPHTVTMTSGSGIFNCIHGIARMMSPGQPSPDTQECSHRPYWKVSRLITTRDDEGYLITVGSDDAAGGYSLHVQDNVAIPPTVYDTHLPASDLPSDTSTQGLIHVNDSWVNGTAVVGEIELALDADWYRVELEANRRYQIDVQGVSSDAGTIIDTNVWLHDADGNRVEGTFDSDSGSHLEARLVYHPSVTGTYFIEVGAGSYEIGSYSVSVIDIADPDAIHRP